MEQFAVLVGGKQMTSAYLTWDEAVRIRKEYLDEGYLDVCILNKFTGKKE